MISHQTWFQNVSRSFVNRFSSKNKKKKKKKKERKKEKKGKEERNKENLTGVQDDKF